MLKIFLAVAAVTVVTLSSCATAAEEQAPAAGATVDTTWVDTSAVKDSTK